MRYVETQNNCEITVGDISSKLILGPFLTLSVRNMGTNWNTGFLGPGPDPGYKSINY